jgi:hypothetical protein
MTAESLKKILLADKLFGRKEALGIAAEAAGSASYFAALMQCFLGTEYRLVQRAAWSVGWAARKNPGMIIPYIPVLVNQLQNKEAPVAVVRNCAGILQDVDIPEPYQGTVMNACFDFVTTPEAPVAVKAFALTILYNLSRQHPDIQPELQLIIEERWDQETAAFRSRGKKILKALLSKKKEAW